MANNPEQGSNLEGDSYTQEDFDRDWQKYTVEAIIGSANLNVDEYITGMQRFSQAYANGMRPTNPIEDTGDIKYEWGHKPNFDDIEIADWLRPHWHPRMPMGSLVAQGPSRTDFEEKYGQSGYVFTNSAHYHMRNRVDTPRIEELGDQQTGSQPKSALQKRLAELQDDTAI